MITYNCEQGSEEWLAARAGCATSSEFSSVLAKGQGKTRLAYLRRVVAERLTGKPMETYHNAHMDRGTEQEPYARLAYEERSGFLVDPIGFIRHDNIAAGCSPDGLVGDDGGVEIKCVIPTVQIETILAGQYPPEHKAQIQGTLWLTKRSWVDYVSFSPDLPEKMRTYVYRVTPDKDYILNLQAEVAVFLIDVEKVIEQLERSSA